MYFKNSIEVIVVRIKCSNGCIEVGSRDVFNIGFMYFIYSERVNIRMVNV